MLLSPRSFLSALRFLSLQPLPACAAQRVASLAACAAELSCLQASSSASSASFHSSAHSSSSASSSSSGSSSPLPPRSRVFHALRDNPGAKTRVRRKGRGVGSGHGLARSAGLGSKGQKSHGGGLAITFEGGQSPLWKRTPKYGDLPKMFRREVETLNLSKFQVDLEGRTHRLYER